MKFEQRMIIANAIKEGRKNVGLTQEQLGDKLGYVKQTISNWENGRNDVPDEDIDRLNEVLNLKISKKALMNMEERNMRKMMIKPLEEIDKFEDYCPVFDEAIRLVTENDSSAVPYKIVMRKFLYISTVCAMIDKKRLSWEESSLWDVTGYNLLTIINANSFEKIESEGRSVGIAGQLERAKKKILDSYSNVYNIGELENIVLEEKYEETLADYATAYIDDIKAMLPNTDNSFMTVLMVYLMELKRTIELF